jgi:hypothetical protein
MFRVIFRWFILIVCVKYSVYFESSQPSILRMYMFRVLLCPSSGARQTATATSGFRMNVEVEVFSAVVGMVMPETC